MGNTKNWLINNNWWFRVAILLKIALYIIITGFIHNRFENTLFFGFKTEVLYLLQGNVIRYFWP
jgi:hypothetical protein